MIRQIQITLNFCTPSVNNVLITLLIMTISNVLEHWATIYKPLFHDPISKKLEEQSFFRIRDIDEENIFSRNANIIHSPCMLYRVVNSGELISDK